MVKVRSLVLLLLLTHPTFCFSQVNYEVRLTHCLDLLRKDQAINHLEALSGGRLITDYPEWSGKEKFYEGDRVRLGEQMFLALRSSQNENPVSSVGVWGLIERPYLFLKDSAKTPDVLGLLDDQNPYIRVLAFATLASRKQPDLFSLLMLHLRDTTEVEYFEFDVGDQAYPADLMMAYAASTLTNLQKDSLVRLLLYKYPRLKTLREILIFHPANERDYGVIRELAAKKENSPYAIIALSRYRKTEDLDVLRSVIGLDHQSRFKGRDVGYLAIENFPHPSFKPAMIARAKKMNLNDHSLPDEFFFRALTSFRDPECYKAIKSLVRQKQLKGNSVFKFNRNSIYRALRDLNDPFYMSIVMELDKVMPADEKNWVGAQYIFDSSWNVK